MRTLWASRITGSVAQHIATIPDAPGALGQDGPTNTFIKSVRGCMYVAASAVATISLRFVDNDSGTNHRIVLGSTAAAGGAAVQMPFAFENVNIAIEGGIYTGFTIEANSSGAAQTHTGVNASHIVVAYEHYSGELAGDKF